MTEPLQPFEFAVSADNLPAEAVAPESAACLGELSRRIEALWGVPPSRDDILAQKDRPEMQLRLFRLHILTLAKQFVFLRLFCAGHGDL